MPLHSLTLLEMNAMKTTPVLKVKLVDWSQSISSACIIHTPTHTVLHCLVQFLADSSSQKEKRASPPLQTSARPPAFRLLLPDICAHWAIVSSTHAHAHSHTCRPTYRGKPTQALVYKAGAMEVWGRHCDDWKHVNDGWLLSCWLTALQC